MASYTGTYILYIKSFQIDYRENGCCQCINRKEDSEGKREGENSRVVDPDPDPHGSALI